MLAFSWDRPYYSFLYFNFILFLIACASNPWLTLFIGACIVTTLGHGIKYLDITTDPVELWAAPYSRSRVERKYFDENFEPFYRTEQIIIHAVGLDDVSYTYITLYWNYLLLF